MYKICGARLSSFDAMPSQKSHCSFRKACCKVRTLALGVASKYMLVLLARSYFGQCGMSARLGGEGFPYQANRVQYSTIAEDSARSPAVGRGNKSGNTYRSSAAWPAVPARPLAKL